ncbi:MULTISPECIES: recombination mediator RecR [Culturomica]|jgi:recombination protein RecR|uniref:recombination mediator RecR n=1 Tax=Culturomica TaxID=1926651 RepID=UPI0003396F04|nr:MULTISPECIES: recombination mediator RecR [Odoribacteraceae]RHV92118.1 recombination protein RecR [Odoribacter sp. OF09-27XD]CCZ09923.1 recombination protein RecR [Odoribacter sp. CAG:788]HBO26965.1 recombination protein RecR [Culturomica sp.]
MQSFSSKLLEKAVEQFASLPGVGHKTALKYALHLLKRNPEEVRQFIKSLSDLKENIHECRECHNISDGELCEICSDPKRETSLICVVESIKDIMSIEATSQYHGLYHVLGGIISPMEGIGPADIHIESLLQRIATNEIKEIIFALSATIEGDTTGYYIYKKIKNRENLTISTIAKGISIGNDLEYTDALTLGRSIVNRVSFSES